MNTIGIWWEVYKASPDSPLPIYSDGIYGMDDPLTSPIGKNSYFLLRNGGTATDKRTGLTSDFELQEKMDYLTKGLSLKAKFSFDNYFASTGRNITDNTDNYTRKYFDLKSNSWVYFSALDGTNGFDFVAPPLAYVNEAIAAENTQRNLYYELSLNYKRSFGKHNISALALFSRQENAKGINWPGKREDWVSRITYDYKGKYLFEANGAYNGSAQFGPGYKFDIFPSIAVGWRVSEENFIKNNIPQLSNLKLRYSIGWVGNDNLGKNVQWAYLTTWNQFDVSQNVNAKKTAFGSGAGTNSIYTPNSYVEGTPGNPTLQWEKARKQNFGGEIGLFKDLITGTVDYFKDYRYDMLISSDQRSVPDYFGQTAPAANLGIVQSHGFEIEFKIQKKFDKLNLWASYNWTQAINEIIYKEDPVLTPFYQKQEGYQIGQVTSSYTSGFIGSWDQLYTGVMSEASLGRTQSLPGDLRTIDYNADGVINSNDVQPYGYAPNPQKTYGFSFGGDYKGFSASVQFYGTYNTTINVSTVSSFKSNAPVTFNYLQDKIFTPEYGVVAPTLPAYRLKSAGTMAQFTQIDGAVFRLKTFQLSYSIPKKVAKALSADVIKIFVNGNNLLLWSKLPYDVEGTSLSDNRYPTTRNINFGLNVSL